MFYSVTVMNKNEKRDKETETHPGSSSVLVDEQSFPHTTVCNERLLVADDGFYMLAEVDFSLSGVGIISQNIIYIT